MITTLTTTFKGKTYELNMMANSGVKSENDFILSSDFQKHIGIFTFILPEDQTEHSCIFDALVNESEIEFEKDGDLYLYSFDEQETSKGVVDGERIVYQYNTDVTQHIETTLPPMDKLSNFKDTTFLIERFGEGWSSAKILAYLDAFYSSAKENNLQLICTTFRSAEVFHSHVVTVDNIWFIQRDNVFDSNDITKRKIIGTKDVLYSLLSFKLDMLYKSEQKLLSDLYKGYLMGRFGATWV